MRNIVLYQYDSNEAKLSQMTKCVLSRESNLYDDIPDEIRTYAVTTIPPKKQMLVAPNSGEVIDVGEGIYRVWFDEVNPKAAVQALGDHIMASVIVELNHYRQAIDNLVTEMEHVTELIDSGGSYLLTIGS